MTKSEAIEQILKDNDDYVKVVHQGEVIMDQIKQPTCILAEGTDDHPIIFAPPYDAGLVEFSPEKLVEGISPDFWISQGRIKEPTDELLLNIKNLTKGHRIWEVPHGHLKVHGITFFAEQRQPQSLREAIDKCLTTFVPEYQIISCSDWITFILPEDKIQPLLLAMDFAGDKLTPNPFGLTQRNPTLDRK